MTDMTDLDWWWLKCVDDNLELTAEQKTRQTTLSLSLSVSVCVCLWSVSMCGLCLRVVCVSVFGLCLSVYVSVCGLCVWSLCMCVVCVYECGLCLCVWSPVLPWCCTQQCLWHATSTYLQVLQPAAAGCPSPPYHQRRSPDDLQTSPENGLALCREPLAPTDTAIDITPSLTARSRSSLRPLSPHHRVGDKWTV